MGLIAFLIIALLTSVFVNFAVLHRLAKNHHDEAQAGSVEKVEKTKPRLGRSEIEHENEMDAEKVGGVAVALLLHAPKWFQRRYTMSVQNVYNNIPANWRIQIFYTPHGASQIGIDLNRGLQRMVASGKVVLTEIAPVVIAERKKRIELMTHRWIWENMLADKVFIFGGNGVICSNSPQNFTSLSQEYAYLGAPWSQFKGRGGDGGMSFRNRKLMLAAIDYEQSKTPNDPLVYKKWGQEDHFFVKTILEMEKQGALPVWEGARLKIAAKEETEDYGATGSIARDTALVASGTLPGLDDKAREAFMQVCPEVKIFYPALHNPNCFGAVVHKEECAASICALNKEKGGC